VLYKTTCIRRHLNFNYIIYYIEVYLQIAVSGSFGIDVV